MLEQVRKVMQIHHDLCKGCMSLEGKSPGEVAGIKMPGENK